MAEMSPDGSGDTTPRPDPTVATNDAVDRAQVAMHAYVDGQFEVRDERLRGIDRATTLRLGTIDSFPDRINEEVGHLRELMDQKFDGVEKQFVERDTRGDKGERASADALAAALQAAKELVNAQGEASAAAAVKSETSFTKQIDQLATLIESKDKASDARITELKERIDRGEGQQSGAQAAHVEVRADRGEHRSDAAFIVSVVVALLVGVGIALSVAALVLGK